MQETSKLRVEWGDLERRIVAPNGSAGAGRSMPSSFNRCSALPAESLRGLPFANVRAAVHVQHLPCDVTGLRQINDSLSDVLRIRDRTHR
jgi:hypothetical protein